MNKLELPKFILIHLVVSVVLIGLAVFFGQMDNQTLPKELSKHQLSKSIKQAEFAKLQQQLKIHEIDLVANIDDVKKFINIHGNELTLNKSKINNRGIEYLLSGKSIDVLVLLYKATQQALKIDINRFLFEEQDELIVEMTIVGVEQ